MAGKAKNTLCIFCYKKTVAAYNNNEDKNVSQFLKCFSQYLNIILQSSEEEVITNEFVICDDCCKLVGNFNELFFQLECLKLKVNWQVHQLLEKLKFSERVPSRFFHFKSQFEKDDDASQKVFGDIQQLRVELIKHSKVKLDLSFPKLSLKNICGDGDIREFLSTNKFITSNKKVTECQSAEEVDCENEVIIKCEEIEIEDDHHNLPGSFTEPDEPDEELAIPSYAAEGGISLRSLFKCHQCPRTFPNLERLTVHMKIHNEFEMGSGNRASKHNIEMDTDPNEEEEMEFDRISEQDTSQAVNDPLNFHLETNSEEYCMEKIVALPSKADKNWGEGSNSRSSCERQKSQTNFMRTKPEISRFTGCSSSKYHCDFDGCGKRFNTNSSLYQHKRRHGERRFKCSWEGCKWEFFSGPALYRHEKTHIGTKPFQCPVCQKEFARSDNCERHKKTHEKNERLESS